ncbi:MAG: RNA polymerase sporulation sigma factor SigG [Clostridiales bacterium]|nr:RNA polymerase sporulation sigma factor SigG [Candidatus Coliplasma equi]
MLNKVEICGVNTSKLKVLTDEEKTELLKKARSGDKFAREELINGNLKLVLSVIQSFKSRSDNLDDLFQVGCIGLIKAIDGFDTSLDVKLSTYAVPMIIGELRRYLRDYNAVRVPRSLRDIAYKALRMKERLTFESGREPTVEENAKEISETPENVTKALDAIQDPISIYEPIYSDSGDSLYVLDQISDDNSKDEIWLDNIAVNNAMLTLADRERKIILMRFFHGKTQTEVSEEIGISQAQVSRIEKNALGKIKKMMI